jgi:hypothetical protein
MFVAVVKCIRRKLATTVAASDIMIPLTERNVATRNAALSVLKEL